MAWQEVVYEGTWHFDWELDCSLEPIDSPKDETSSPYKYDFGEIPLRPIPWDEPGPTRQPVRVTIWDDPEVFHVLSEADRHYLLLYLANCVAAMLRFGYHRSQYGFPVRVKSDGPHDQYFHAEYHMALIKTDFPDPGQPPRHIAKIWRGALPKGIRKGYKKQND